MWCASGAAVHARSSSTGSHAVRTTTVTVYYPHRNPPCIGHFHVYPCIRSTPLREYAAAIITPHRLCGAGLWSSEWLGVALPSKRGVHTKNSFAIVFISILASPLAKLFRSSQLPLPSLTMSLRMVCACCSLLVRLRSCVVCLYQVLDFTCCSTLF